MDQQNGPAQNFTPLNTAQYSNSQNQKPQNKKSFIRYLFISVVGHIVIAVLFYVVAMLGGLAGLGNASASTGLFFNILILSVLLALLAFQIFLLRRKSLSIFKRIIVTFFPLLLGIILTLSINPAGEALIKNIESRAFTKVTEFIHFDGTFTIENSENNMFSHHSIIVPFKSDKEFGLNRFMFAYFVEIEGQTLNSEGNNISECPTNNNVFTKIVDKNGKSYEVRGYTGDDIKLPPGQYKAYKHFSVNVAGDMEKVCYEKVLNLLKENGILNIYYSNTFSTTKKIELVTELQLENK